jgi:hypothetical protein
MSYILELRSTADEMPYSGLLVKRFNDQHKWTLSNLHNLLFQRTNVNQVEIKQEHTCSLPRSAEVIGIRQLGK